MDDRPRQILKQLVAQEAWAEALGLPLPVPSPLAPSSSPPQQAVQLTAERASAARDVARLEQQLLRVAGAASL